MNCDILLFDLDGTLTDSGPGIMHAAQYALRGGGIEVADSSTLSFFVGPPLADIFLRYFPPQEVGAAIARFREYYRETGWLENAPYPGIEACLQALCAAGKTLYVATSKLETLAFQVLSHFGLDRYFAGIFGAPPDDVDAGRKAAVIGAALSAAHCTDPSRAVMIGDREHDILGGRQVGVRTIGVLYGYGSLNELTQAGADDIAATPEQLRDLILRHD